MKTALIAAGILTAATFTTTPEATAKDLQFGLTIGGPNGYLQISAPGKGHGSKHKTKSNKHYSQGYGNSYGYGGGYGYGQNQGYGRGYGYGRPHGGQFNLKRARANGYCMYPNDIRRNLRQQGWHGFQVKKVEQRFAIVKSRYHGARYRLKVDRCTGQVLKAKALGGYRGYGGYRNY